MNEKPDSSHIMQTSTAFWASKVLLTAVEFDLFSTLGKGSLTAKDIEQKLEFHPSAVIQLNSRV